MFRRSALLATLAVGIAVLAACSTEPSRYDDGGDYSAPAVVPVDGRATGSAADRIQTGNLPSG